MIAASTAAITRLTINVGMFIKRSFHRPVNTADYSLTAAATALSDLVFSS